MAASTQTKTRFLGTITITPGSGSAYTVSVEDGDMAIAGLVASYHEAILVEDRGEFSTLVAGKRKYPTFSFTANLCDIVDATDPTLPAICLRLGPYAAATSTLGANRQWTVDVLWTINGTDQGDAANHTISLEDCRIEEVNPSEGDLNKLAISGICYGTITMT